MPRQYTVNPDTLQPLSVRPEDLSPVSSMPTFEDQTRISWDDAVETLPTVMGGAMSLAGGGRSTPVGMLLAGIGGAGGEGYRQAINALQGDWDQVPPDLRSQAQAIVQEFATQGGTEGIGRAFGPLLKFFGRAMYGTALKAPKAVHQEYPTVVKDAVAAGIPITRSKAGTAKAERVLDEAGDKVSEALAIAQARGAAPVDMVTATQATHRTAQEIGKQAAPAAGLSRLQRRRADILRQNPPDIDLARAQEMKRAEQKLAIQAYRARAKGAPVNDVDTAVHEDVARGLREQIEQSADAVGVENVGPLNADVQRKIGVLKAVEGAEDRIANNNLIGMGDFLSAGFGLGTGAAVDPIAGAGTFLLTEGLTRPEIASRVGIGLDRTGNPRVTPNLLRALQVLSGLLGESEQ